MNLDFSEVNVEYLILTRDLAMRDPELVATMLGMEASLAELLAGLKPRDLSRISLIKQPLVVPRQQHWWWLRLVTAIRDGRIEEIKAVIEHVPLITVV